MLCGILCRQSARVAEITRSLNERIRLIKTLNPAEGGGVPLSRRGGLSRHRRDWQIEETIWFTKETYGIEDIPLRRYSRFQNIVALAFAAVYLAAVWLGREMKPGLLLHHALAGAKRFFVIPDFPCYAAADGIKSSLEGCQTPLFPPRDQPRADPQLMLPI